MIEVKYNNHRITINKFDTVVITYYGGFKTGTSFIFNNNHQLVIDFIFLSDFKLLVKSTEMFDWKWLEGSLYLLTLNEVGKLKLL